MMMHLNLITIINNAKQQAIQSFHSYVPLMYSVLSDPLRCQKGFSFEGNFIVSNIAANISSFGKFSILYYIQIT